MGIYLNDAELTAFRSLDPLLVKAYVWMRSKMDRRTRIAGRVTTISLGAIAEAVDYEIRKGQGSQWIRLGETPKQRKDAADRIVERLGKAGLIAKLGGALLCFLFPLADEAEVRPNQTGVERATGFSTERATRDESENPREYWDSGDYSGKRATPENGQNASNGRHIKGQEVYPPQSSSTDSTGVAPGDAGAAGVNRDRPAASQAGSLGRPGSTQEDPDRDRPAGSHVGPQGADSDETSHRDRPAASHPAPGRRLPGAAQPLGALLPAGSSETPGCSAENESTPVDRASPEAAALLDVLQRCGINARGAWAQVAQWAADGVTPDVLAEVVERALAARRKVESVQPINMGFIGTILHNDRRQAARTAQRIGGGLSSGTSGLDAMARQLGIALARPGETNEQYRERVSQAWSGRKQGGAGNGTA